MKMVSHDAVVRVSVCIMMASLLLPGQSQQKTQSGDAGRAAKSGEPAPQLRTSGVRGSLDSGGYSAPAAAKQESVLIDAIMRLQLEVLGDALNLQVTPPCSIATKALLLGIAEEGRDKFEAAEEQFRTAAQIAPTEQTLFAWGSALLLLGRADRARDVFTKAAAQFPRSTVLLVGRGAALYQQASVGEAMKIWLQAAELNPAASAPYTFIANSLNSSVAGSPSEAAAEKLRALVTTAPNNAQANYAYACSLLAANGPAPASQPAREIENKLQRAIALNPAFSEAHFKLASFYGQRGEYRLALHEYQKAIEGDPDLAEAHYRLGQLYMRTGDRDNAERELAQHRALRDAHQHNVGDQNIHLAKALQTLSGKAKASDLLSCSAGIR
jgi:tetratricopeptide (TPR) repeat protein